MKDLFLEALSGATTLEKIGLIAITSIVLIAILGATVEIAIAYRHVARRRAILACWAILLWLDDLEARMTRFGEKNDRELKACREIWWSEAKALQTEMPSWTEIIGEALKNSIR